MEVVPNTIFSKPKSVLKEKENVFMYLPKLTENEPSMYNRLVEKMQYRGTFGFTEGTSEEFTKKFICEPE